MENDRTLKYNLNFRKFAKANIMCNNLCSGCGVCAGGCPQDAIRIKLNKNGFYRPIVDSKICTECGLCLQICPFCENIKDKKKYTNIGNKGRKIFGEILCVYAGWHKDDKIRYKSASGGIATALSEYFIRHGYKVGGTFYDSKALRAKSCIVSNIEEIYKFASSKYIPSEYSAIARYIRKNKNEKLLIIGLPCQIAGIRNMIGYKTKNIILVDILCARMTSYKLFYYYLQYYSFKRPVINFRDKKTGWNNFSIFIEEKNKRHLEYFRESLFGIYFNSKVFTQDACYECFVGCAGVSDITLGDFWNNKKYKDNKTGVSLIIVRTDKGKTALDNLDNVVLYEEKKKELFNSQGHFISFKFEKEKLKKINEIILREVNVQNFAEFRKFLLKETFIRKVKRKIFCLLKRYL